MVIFYQLKGYYKGEEVEIIMWVFFDISRNQELSYRIYLIYIQEQKRGFCNVYGYFKNLEQSLYLGIGEVCLIYGSWEFVLGELLKGKFVLRYLVFFYYMF